MIEAIALEHRASCEYCRLHAALYSDGIPDDSPIAEIMRELGLSEEEARDYAAMRLDVLDLRRQNDEYEEQQA